ncbi:MAG TPA: type II toxin-antitoxin system VapC family toxin [Geopsychrobacteraceae bacterium]|jgi:predicted nucleic acid-binding protein
MLLVDTDVLIWYLRGKERAYEAIESLNGFSISVITYMELVQGMRNKQELNSLRQALRRWNAGVIYVSEEISAKAMFYVEQHFLSHSLELADALIGASAISHGIPLLTGKEKHYRMLSDLELLKFDPEG